MKKLVSSFAATAVGLSLAVSGCTSQTAGTAALVGHEKIAQSRLDKTVAALKSHTPAEKRGGLAGSVLQTMILGSLLDQVARDKHVAPSQEDRGKIRAKVVGANPFLAGDELKDFTDDVVSVNTYVARYGEQKVVDMMKDYKVEANPRYGVWSPEQFSFYPAQMVSSSLSQPFPVASPTAAER